MSNIKTVAAMAMAAATLARGFTIDLRPTTAVTTQMFDPASNENLAVYYVGIRSNRLFFTLIANKRS